jgi:hypothetical protein
MDIAAYATNLKAMLASYQENIALMRMIMDTAQTNSDLMTRMIEQNTKVLEQSVQPHLGGRIDFKI